MRFEDAVHSALQAARERLPDPAAPVTIVRDVAGRITLVLNDEALPDIIAREALAEHLHALLGRFSPGPQHVLLSRGDLVDEGDVIGSPDRVRLADATNVWLVDRLLTNQE